MKAMRAAQFGGPELLRLEEAPNPQLKDNHVLIRVKATGINPADLVRLSGRYPQALPLPYTPGTDVAGEVEAIGTGIAHVTIGDRVFGRSLNGGGYAQKALLPKEETIPLPANLSFAEGAAIPVPFYTAYVALHYKAQLKAGETVLVSAGGGGVGVAALQLAKAVGARVITTVGSEEKAARTRALGADVAINYKTQDFVAEIQQLTDSKGVDVIIENVATDRQKTYRDRPLWSHRNYQHEPASAARAFAVFRVDERCDCALLLLGNSTERIPESQRVTFLFLQNNQSPHSPKPIRSQPHKLRWRSLAAFGKLV
jgi:NADPH:quinone reductase-like Zn-dependent oxidoreductase